MIGRVPPSRIQSASESRRPVARSLGIHATSPIDTPKNRQWNISFLRLPTVRPWLDAILRYLFAFALRRCSNNSSRKRVLTIRPSSDDERVSTSTLRRGLRCPVTGLRIRANAIASQTRSTEGRRPPGAEVDFRFVRIGMRSRFSSLDA